MPISTCIRWLYLVTILAVTLSTPYAAETTYCSSSYELRTHEGTWIRKGLWEKLRTARNWSDLRKCKEMESPIATLNIPVNGRFNASMPGWHEGIDACIKFTNEQLWATTTVDPENITEASRKLEWIGPFVRVGPAFAEGRIFLQGIFGNRCFISDRNEQWCFGPGYIVINENVYSAKIILDPSELPNQTAFAVKTKPLAETLISSPTWYLFGTDTGWKVYEEGQLAPGGRPENVDSLKPWRILRPGTW